MDVDATPDAAPEPERHSEPFDAQPGPRAQLAAIVEVLSVLARSSSSQTEVFDSVVNNAQDGCAAPTSHRSICSQLTAWSSPTRWGSTQEYVRFAEVPSASRWTGTAWLDA